MDAQGNSVIEAVPAPPAEAGAAPAGVAVRAAARAALAEALLQSRADTLRTFAAYRLALDGHGMAVPYQPDVNPPLWELGHVGWFQEWWVGRNPQRPLGVHADPEAARPEGVRMGSDALYDSSRVAHATRWQLPLPGIEATCADLARQLDRTLALLAGEPDDADRTLYFYRLALLHEDMHHEAAVYMAQTLAIDLDDARWQPQPMAAARDELALGAASVDLGSEVGSEGGSESGGFRFDNECGRRVIATAPFRIDRRPVNWAEWISFAEAGAYDDSRLWTAEGWAWRQQHWPDRRDGPAALRRGASGWQRRFGSRWSALDGAALQQAACHITLHEALAWCRWAGRRLPSEAEWQRAALERADTFAWGQVWEWTANAFAPYEGFTPHPYRDYSQPWFDGRPVLKGASWATQPRMRHPRYRNFFAADRADIVAGLRSCAV